MTAWNKIFTILSQLKEILFSAYLRRRIIGGLSAIVGVSVVVFLLIHLIPGNPVDNLLGERADPADKLEMQRCMDLDQPLPIQFGRFALHVLDGTLGRTCPDQRRTVSQFIFEALPYTLELAVAAILVALAIALPLGILAALRPRSAIDALVTMISLAGISIPTPWLGPLLIALFYQRLHWLPGPADEAGLRGLILPAVMLGTHLTAMLTRMTRSSLLDVLSEDYIRTARAKGLSEWSVISRHALRNALVPVITVVGIQFGSLLAGAVITEQVFARPGIGTLLLEAINRRDYRMVQGCTLVIATSYVLVNMMVDIAYGIVDPRIRVK